MTSPPTFGGSHLDALAHSLDDLRTSLPQLQRWGTELVAILSGGGRLLAAGNGGSAAQAQHLTSELVGRYSDERPAFSAISLHADMSALTAIGNDYGYSEVFARQVRAHGRPDDLLVLLSTSGRSPNLLRAADVGVAASLRVWALTGPLPNPLASAAHEVVAINTATAATVQELHLVAVHLLCLAFDRALEHGGSTAGRDGRANSHRPTGDGRPQPQPRAVSSGEGVWR